jgi:hypothetical protein
MTDPKTAFDPNIYADATLAGLSVLIPVPLIDWLFETFFERRIPFTIARRRNHKLTPDVIAAFREPPKSWLRSCLGLVLGLTIGLIKRISRKILYFLTIKEATDKVSFHWRQAFLIDYMILNGHLDQPESARLARLAMDQILRTTPNSVLIPLAHYVVTHARQILRAIWKARRGKVDQEVEQRREEIAARWRRFREYFQSLATLYEQCYQELKNRPPVLTDTSTSETGTSGGLS